MTRLQALHLHVCLCARQTATDVGVWVFDTGRAMASNETEARKLAHLLDADYVLVIFGGLIGYQSDDINKFLWMVGAASSHG